MKVINLRIRNIKIDSNMKIIAIMTAIIFIVLIILPLILLRTSKSDIGIFNLSNGDIVKNSRITFPMNGKVKLYRKVEDKVEEIDLEEYIMGVVASEVPANFNEGN